MDSLRFLNRMPIEAFVKIDFFGGAKFLSLVPLGLINKGSIPMKVSLGLNRKRIIYFGFGVHFAVKVAQALNQFVILFWDRVAL